MRAFVLVVACGLIGLLGVTRAAAIPTISYPRLPDCEQNLAKKLTVSGLEEKYTAIQPLSSWLIPSIGFATADMSRAIDPAVGNYMNQYGLPGGAVAMTYRGRLIFAKSYGYMSVSNAAFAQPDTRFRLASVSKAFTAMAIMKLIHDEKLSLDYHPFPFANVGPIIGGTAPNYYQGGTLNPELKKITVDDLLHHAGGWNRDDGPDFTGYGVLQPLATYLSNLRHTQQGPPDCTTLLSWVESQPLQFEPGTRNDYSNIGFCALSEVVREKGGPTYIDYLSDNVLHPLGLSDTTLGSTQQSKRQDREATYYSFYDSPSASLFPPYEIAYGPYSNVGALESLQGAGGLVSTAIDVAHFAGAIATGDLPNLGGGADSSGWPKTYYVDAAKVPGYECTTNTSQYPPSAACPPHSSSKYQNAHTAYGPGWDGVSGNAVSQPLVSFDNYNFVKDGGMPGTSSSVAVTADGYGFAAVFNGDYKNAAGAQWKIFWPHALPAAYKHAGKQPWNIDFNPQYAQRYTDWMLENAFKEYAADEAKRGYYPSRLEGRIVARLRHHSVDNPKNPSSSGIEYRARFARSNGGAVPKVMYGASCPDLLREIDKQPASRPLVSLQRYLDQFTGAYMYQAVWAATIPQLP